MTDKKNKKSQPAADTQAAEAPEVMDILENEDGNPSETEVEEVEAAADLTAQLDEVRAAIEKEKKEYLFLWPTSTITASVSPARKLKC